MSNKTIQEALQQLTGFSELSRPQQAHIQNHAHIRHAEAGTAIFRDHTACRDFIFLLNGRAHVQKISENGHEIILYHLKQGDTCGLTASSLLGHTPQHANLIAEMPLDALILAYDGFQSMMDNSQGFQSFVLSAIDNDVNRLIQIMEDVSFSPIAHRLAHKLLEYGTQQAIHVTHQQLAAELGTAREVISRSLKKMEQQGHIKCYRACIEILNPDELRLLIQK